MNRDKRMILRGIGIGIILTAAIFYMFIAFSQIDILDRLKERENTQNQEVGFHEVLFQ